MRRTKFFAVILAAALLLCACSGTAEVKQNQNLPDSRSEMTKWVVNERQLEFLPQTVEHGVDEVIQWTDPAMEAHIRSLLNKPTENIRRSDVWDIQVLRLNSKGSTAAWKSPSEGTTFNSIDNTKDAEFLAEGDAIKNLTSLQDLQYFDSLQAFYYTGKTPCEELDLSGVEKCSGLKYLSIHDAKPTTLEPLASLTGLEGLDLYNCGTLDLTALKSLKKLSRVSLQADTLISLEPLASLPELYSLRIGVGTTYPSLEPLTQTKLKFLDMGTGQPGQSVYKGMDYEPLTRMPTLQYLNLTNHLDVTTDLCVQIVENSPELRGLDISCTKAADHSDKLKNLDLQWLADTPEPFSPVRIWNRLLYQLA